jgi:hypothetical protein
MQSLILGSFKVPAPESLLQLFLCCIAPLFTYIRAEEIKLRTYTKRQHNTDPFERDCNELNARTTCSGTKSQSRNT